MAECLDAALAYVAEGWRIFPAPPGTKKSHKSAKHSDGRAWGATSDPEEIKRDFAQWPDANIGIPTGVANGFWVIEADTKEGHGVDGIASLRALTEEHGDLPQTLTAESPSRSQHYYFAWPDDVEIRNSSSKIAPGVDVRGEGGMVIAPPSVRSDGTYRWTSDHEIAAAPQWLIDLAVAATNSGNGEHAPNEKLMAPMPVIAAAVAVIPNDDMDWENWNARGMAIFAASGGSNEGFLLFDRFSRRSTKYNAMRTLEKWRSYHSSPPTRIGYGSLHHWANEADPDWLDGRPDEASMEASDKIIMIEMGLKEDQKTEETKSEQPKTEQPKPETPKKKELLQSSKEFVADYKPPDYLIDGLIQRRYVYSLTAPTGDGKTSVILLLAAHCSFGLKLAGREVDKVRVLFFAGENPDDVRARWIKTCEEMNVDPDTMDVFFMPGSPPISNAEIRKRINEEAERKGPFGLLIIDTSAAYFKGEDENSNTQLGEHARMLRSFVNLPGGPTVLVTCHPVKNPDRDNLLPRGGGAFLAEIDGNLVLVREPGKMVVEMTHHGKHRGPDFAPIPFKLVTGQSEKLRDTKGRKVWTVTAQLITEGEREAMQAAGRRTEDEVLKLLADQPRLSIADMARTLGLSYANGEPNRSLVQRILKALVNAKLATKERAGYALTNKGKRALEGIRNSTRNPTDASPM
jgi:hypothetical protein